MDRPVSAEPSLGVLAKEALLCHSLIIAIIFRYVKMLVYPPTASEGSAIGRPTLGEQLRALRRRHAWTLKEVSEKTGLAISTLSKVEHDRMSLTYDKLLQLAEGLGLTMAELFAGKEEGPAVTARRSIAQPGEGLVQTTPAYEYRYLCTELARKRMVPIISRVHVRRMAEFGSPLRHPGEEFIYVLEGTIEVHCDHYEPVQLSAGAGIYLDSTMGHAYLAVGEKDAVILAVCSSNEPNLTESLQTLVRGRAAETEKEPGSTA